MESALVVSNVLLWVAVAALSGVVLVLVRQLGVLHERVAPAGALAAGAGPRPGESVAELALADLDGVSQRVGGADPEGRSTLLFFLSPTCPVCKALLPALRSLARGEARRLRVLLASDGPREEHERFRAEQGIALPYLLSAELGRRLRVAQLPWAVLIDARGVLRARGLVSTREHLESLLEAEAQGVASIQEHLERERRGGAAGAPGERGGEPEARRAARA